MADAIQKELGIAQNLSNKTFEDKEYQLLVEQYISALESQAEGINYFGVDVDKYNAIYGERGSDIRSHVLNVLHNEYGLSVQEQYKKDFEGIIDDTPIRAVRYGEAIEVNTEYGNLRITIDDISEESSSVIQIDREFGRISEDETILVGELLGYK